MLTGLFWLLALVGGALVLFFIEVLYKIDRENRKTKRRRLQEKVRPLRRIER